MPQKDPEERRAYMKAWREKNIERARENQRRYEERNPEKVKERRQRYYRENREKVLARQRAHRDVDPDAFRQKQAQKMRQWREANPEKARLDARRRQVKNKYGLTLEEYNTILARGCAICGSHEKLCLDHDHANGAIRDALCSSCNKGLGHFFDQPARLRAAAEYLEAHRS